MPLRGQDFIGVVAPTDSRTQPVPARTKTLVFTTHYLRDQLKLTTWLCLGALAEVLLFLVVGRRAFIPPAVLLSVRVSGALLTTIGLKRNALMDGVIPKKVSTAFPDESGKYGNKPANSEVCVFLIGTRCNYPLGALAPGMKEILLMFPRMQVDLDKNREEYGFLTLTNWLNADARGSGSELMSVCYFQNYEGLHKFAHSKVHRDGWDWWNKHVKSYPHLSIFHETYSVAKGDWETVYVNSHISGINTANIKYADEMTGKEMYEYPVVDAGRGLLKTSAGRMSRSNATEHDKYGINPYDTQ